MKKIFAITGITLAALNFSQAQEADSVQESSPNPVTIKSTLRIHNQGMFAYGGRLSTSNPALDINFILERNGWGLLCYKAIDLADHTSLNNFCLAVAYRTFKLNKNLTMTPHFGFFLEQPYSFADHGSDMAFINTTSLRLNPALLIEHTALLGNLLIEPDYRDWVNRLRVLFSHGHLDITALLWHNNQVFDQANYTSCSLALAYSRIKLANNLNMSVTLSDMALVKSSNEVAVPEENSVILTVAMHFVKN